MSRKGAGDMGLTEKSFRNGEIIIKEGDAGKSFFRLLEGKAGVYADYGKNDPMKIAVLEEGEYFGEMAIIEEYPRSATVVAVGNVKVVEIPGDDLRAYFKKNPDQIIELMQHLGKRISSMTKDYNDAKALLKELRESDSGKKNKSLFAKIKKHIDIYQSNKTKLTEPSAEALREKFAELKDEGTGKNESFRKGVIIYREGDLGKCMYILHSGKVGMYNNFRSKEDEVLLYELQAVSFFGEMGMVSDDTREATAVSESNDTYVEVIYPYDLEDMFKTCPAKVDLILSHLSFNLRKLTIDFLKVCKEITESYGDN